MLATTFVLLPLVARGQTQDPSPGGLAAAIALDPTTYAPAVAFYVSARMDWSSSQPLFRNGFLEANPVFTISGRPMDVALSYGAGNRRILNDAFVTLELSAMNNLIDRVSVLALSERFPQHRTLIRRLGLVERITVASLTSYELSAAHLQQWRTNRDLVRQLGY